MGPLVGARSNFNGGQPSYSAKKSSFFLDIANFWWRQLARRCTEYSSYGTPNFFPAVSMSKAVTQGQKGSPAILMIVGWMPLARTIQAILRSGF